MNAKILIVISLLLAQSVYADTKSDFWKWLKNSEERVSTAYPSQQISNEIYSHLVQYDNQLAVIFPSYGAKPREIVISCSGNPERIESINALFSEKPAFTKITVTKFVQPGMAFLPMQVLGRVVPFQNVGVSADKLGTGYLVTVYSGKFQGIDQNAIGSDLFSYFLFQLGEEGYMAKVKDVKILPVSMVSPEIVAISSIGAILK